MKRGLVLIAITPVLGGCLERTVTITSEPPGAIVVLNDEEIGRTPVETGFRYFGVYDVRLQREGYEPIVTEKEAVAPIWEYPGLDLLAIAAPWRVKTHLEWHFDLEPVPEAGTEEAQRAEQELFDRARSLRAASRGE
ncbi:MAG: PEGA domain-containing protein [Phycisphaerales bacterium JB058]